MKVDPIRLPIKFRGWVSFNKFSYTSLMKFIDKDTSSWKNCLNEVYVFVIHNRKATADT